MTAIHYRTAKVDRRNVCYREAGAAGALKLLLRAAFAPIGNSPPGHDFTTPTHSMPMMGAASAHSSAQHHG